VITVVCPGCRKSYQVSEASAGRSAKCRKCGQAIRIASSTAPPPKPETATVTEVSPPEQSRQSVARQDEERRYKRLFFRAFLILGGWSLMTFLLPLALNSTVKPTNPFWMVLFITGALAFLGAVFIAMGAVLVWFIGRLMKKTAEIDALVPAWPGPPTCFYCCKQPMTHHKEYPFHLVLDRSVTKDHRVGDFGSYEVTVSYKSASIYVPRCNDCRELHKESRRQLIRAGIIAVIGGLPLLAAAAFRYEPALLVSSLVLVSFWVYAGIVAFGAERYQKRGIRRYEYSQVASHPDYIRLCREGYRPGKDPSTRAEIKP
jgi:hypothetical protein